MDIRKTNKQDLVEKNGSIEEKHSNNLLDQKKIPSDFIELPYEKFEKRGPQALSDAELLAILLQTGSKDKSVIELATILMQKAADYGTSFDGLSQLSYQDLLKIDGIGRVKAIRIKIVFELSKRIRQSTYESKLSYTSPESIASYFMEQMMYEQVETVRIALFNNKMNYIGDKVVSIGTINASLISGREIFHFAIQMNAAIMILLHNHPSGDPTPSREDVNMTKNIHSLSLIMGIELADHIVIGKHCYYSFRENSIEPYNHGVI